jgi:type IV pilus assembly protein PilO
MASAFLAPIVNASKTQKSVLGVLLLLGLVGAGYFFVLAPLGARVAELRTRNDSLQAEVAQNRALAANLERFRQEAAVLKARLDAVRERLPREKDVPPLYRAVSDLAFRTGLAVSLFQPKEPQTKDYYTEVPITLSAETGYHELAIFFERLGRLPRVVNVDDIRLTGLNKPTNTMRADLTLVTYTYRAEDTPEPKPAAKP